MSIVSVLVFIRRPASAYLRTHDPATMTGYRQPLPTATVHSVTGLCQFKPERVALTILASLPSRIGVPICGCPDRRPKTEHGHCDSAALEEWPCDCYCFRVNS